MTFESNLHPTLGEEEKEVRLKENEKNSSRSTLD